MLAGVNWLERQVWGSYVLCLLVALAAVVDFVTVPGLLWLCWAWKVIRFGYINLFLAGPVDGGAGEQQETEDGNRGDAVQETVVDVHQVQGEEDEVVDLGLLSDR